MDLKIQDVANLLNVPEATVQQWVLEGKIPSYRIQQQQRFSRAEIENWVMTHKLTTTEGHSPFFGAEKQELSTDKKPKSAGGMKQFSLFRALHQGDVYHQIPGQTKEDVIRTTVKKASQMLDVDADVMIELLLDRERLMPTALNHGIAVPHTRDTLLTSQRDIVLVVYPEKPLNYGALDGQPVHTLLFLFACEDKRHLHLLAKIAHLSSQPQSLTFLRTQPSKEQLLEFVKQWEGQIPASGE